MAFSGNSDLAAAGWRDHEGSVGLLACSILLSVAMIALGRLIWRVLTSDPYPDVPGPKPEFFLGNAREFLGEHFIYAHLKWHKLFGPVYKVRLFMTQWILVVSDPELAREVLLKNFKVFHDRLLVVPKANMDRRSLAASSGGYWAGLKSALLPMFHSERLRKHSPIMNQAAGLLADNLTAFADSGHSVNLVPLCRQMTADVILQFSFGMSFHAQEGSERAAALLADFNNRVASMMATRTSYFLSLLLPPLEPILYWLMELLPWTPDHTFAKSRRNISKFVNGLVQERSKGTESASERNDLFSMLMQARTKDGGRALKAGEVVAAVSELLSSGQETTMLAISYCVYLLSKHPHVEAKLTQEIDQFFANLAKEDSGEDEVGTEMRPKYEDLEEFPYLDMVINETLRMYPPGSQLLRVAKQDVKLGPYELKKGAGIIVPLYSMLHDENIFPDPFQFKPERFAPEELQSRHRYAFLPFGAGPRVCIGSRLALEEIKIALIHLYKNLTFTIDEERLNNGEIELIAGITVRPKDGIPVFVHRRRHLQGIRSLG